MRRCDRCGKPLTEFETTFHQKADSPPNISGKCWICSGAEEQFMNGYLDKPHHRVEIFVCLLAVALIAALFVPVFPYLQDETLPASLEFYPYVIVVVYFIIGTLITYIIRRRGGKKPKIKEWDPPMTRYRHIYGPDTDIYTTKINRDGDFVTTKETRMGGSIDDRWSAHGSSGSSLVDGVSDFYGKLIPMFFAPILYLFAGGAFVFWVVPYILIMLVRDGNAKKYNKNVPKKLRRAYRHCRKVYLPPISYDDKVGFLVSRENHQNKKAEQKNSFLAQYQQSAVDDSAPFFYTRKNDVSYMIVDYKRDQNKSFGTAFLLVSDGRGNIQKHIVVGDGFLPTDPREWEKEWNEAGISYSVMQNLDWYEKKMKKILKSMKKNSEIVG